MSATDLKRDFVKVLVLPALTFFLVPACSIGFARSGESKLDGLILSGLERSIASDTTLSADEREAATAFYRAHPPSAACGDDRPELAEYRSAVCKPGGEAWQFAWAERAAWAMTLLALAAFFLTGTLAFVAYRAPRLQYPTFMLGWRSLVGITAIQTAVQGVLVVWLSYWSTALLVERYYPKLIVMMAILALMAVLAIIGGLLKKSPDRLPFEAEQVQQADAVFSHELAHFQGGDTAASARLYPALVRYEQYCDSLMSGGLTMPAGHVMNLYRGLFELALRKEQRRRELVADQQAARLTSADDLGRSLLKVAGYSSFRSHTEAELFEQREKHERELGLKARIDAGLGRHVASANFLDAVKTARMPHPFDSHPLLSERLANVQATVRVDDAPQLFAQPPARTWSDEVLTSQAIEDRLWAAYEARFKANHERSLAYRYLPATDEERRLVRSYFPDRAFPLKEGGEVRVTSLGVTLADGQQVPFRDITGAQVDGGNFSTSLVITHGDKEKVKVNLKQLKAHAEPFKAAFSQYWQRDQVARQSAGARAA